MNKTINVNLSGRFFYVDEAAYALLNDYLEKLKITFQTLPVKKKSLEILKRGSQNCLKPLKNKKTK